MLPTYKQVNYQWSSGWDIYLSLSLHYSFRKTVITACLGCIYTSKTHVWDHSLGLQPSGMEWSVSMLLNSLIFQNSVSIPKLPNGKSLRAPAHATSRAVAGRVLMSSGQNC